MKYRENGKTIKIPVQKDNPNLPVTEETPRALLSDSSDARKEPVVSVPERESIDWQDRALRLQAEAENFRKRIERRAASRVREARRELLTRMLAVVDNLERALSHADEDRRVRPALEDNPLYAGVQLTLDDLMNQLAAEGVQPIEALGQPFDPNLHEAIATDGTGGHTVIGISQAGYTIDGELLRPAKVIVGTPTQDRSIHNSIQ